jgi:hypothetical protein
MMVVEKVFSMGSCASSPTLATLFYGLQLAIVDFTLTDIRSFRDGLALALNALKATAKVPGEGYDSDDEGSRGLNQSEEAIGVALVFIRGVCQR